MSTDLWNPDRADGAHAILGRFLDPADRAVAACLLDLPPNLEVARDSVGAIIAPLLLAQLADGSLTSADIALLLQDAGAIRPGIGPARD